jgi:hypothetical protein
VLTPMEASGEEGRRAGEGRLRCGMLRGWRKELTSGAHVSARGEREGMNDQEWPAMKVLQIGH